MNKKKIILLALACGLGCQDAGAEPRPNKVAKLTMRRIVKTDQKQSKQIATKQASADREAKEISHLKEFEESHDVTGTRVSDFLANQGMRDTAVPIAKANPDSSIAAGVGAAAVAGGAVATGVAVHNANNQNQSTQGQDTQQQGQQSDWQEFLYT